MTAHPLVEVLRHAPRTVTRAELAVLLAEAGADAELIEAVADGALDFDPDAHDASVLRAVADAIDPEGADDE